MAVPSLRFKSFNKDYANIPVGKIGKFYGGGTPDTKVEKFWNGSISWISSSDILENDIKSIKVNKFITSEAIQASATRKLPINSLLIISRVGVGKFAIADREICTSQDFTNIIIDDALFSANYIAYNLYKNRTKLLLISQGTSIKGFTTVDLKKLLLNIPTLPEQQKIADFLTSVDEKINLLKKKKELLEQYKKGVMQKIFSQELRFKDDEGKNFPEWEEKKIKDVLRIGSGRDYKHLGEGIIPVYGSGGVMTYVDQFLYEGESIGIGRKGTINKPVFLQGKFWTVDTLFYTHSFEKCLPKFIYYTFLTINWLKHNEAGGVPSLSKINIENIFVGIPSISEQEKIADFLTALDDKIALVEQQINKTELWKKGLLQKMFV